MNTRPNLSLVSKYTDTHPGNTQIHKYRPRKYTNTHQGNTQIHTQETHSFTKLLLVHCKNTAWSGFIWYIYEIFCDVLWQNVEDKNVLWNCSQKRSPHLGARSKVWRAQITITMLSSGLYNKLTGIYHDILCSSSTFWQWNLPLDLEFISWNLKLCCTKDAFYEIL